MNTTNYGLSIWVKVFPPFITRKRRLSFLGAFLLFLILLFSFQGGAQEYQAYPMYKNPWYMGIDENNPLWDFAPRSTVILNGNTTSTLAAEDPTTPVFRFAYSAFCHPVETRLILKPDINLGEEIARPPNTALPEGAIWADTPPSFNPWGKADYLEPYDKTISIGLGLVNITWMYELYDEDLGSTITGPLKRSFLIGPPKCDVKRIYHTHDSGGNPTGAPTVYFPSDQIKAVVHQNCNMSTPTVIITDGEMTAKNYVGFTVLHYENMEADYLGTEVVQVKPYQVDCDSNPFIGAALAPTFNFEQSLFTVEPNLMHELAQLISGTVPDPEGGSFEYPSVFRFSDEESDIYLRNRIIPVRTNPFDPVLVFWKRIAPVNLIPGTVNIIWPFHYEEYSAIWPTESDTILDPVEGMLRSVFFQKIYHNHDGYQQTKAPKVKTAGVKTKIFYNPEISDREPDQYGNLSNPYFGFMMINYSYMDELQAFMKTGRILMLYHTDISDDKPLGALALEYVRVVPYYPNYAGTKALLGSRLRPQVYDADFSEPHVAIGEMMHDSDLTGFIYHHRISGNKEHNLFVVRDGSGLGSQTYMEVFWRRNGRLNIIWPYEMHRYASMWSLEMDDPFNPYLTWSDPPTSDSQIIADYYTQCKGSSPRFQPPIDNQNDPLWPPYQLFLRRPDSSHPGQTVMIPNYLDLDPTIMPYRDIPGGDASILPGQTQIESKIFNVTNEGWTLIRYQKNGGKDDVFFEPVRSRNAHATDILEQETTPQYIGNEILHSYHSRMEQYADFHMGGYVYIDPLKEIAPSDWDTNISGRNYGYDSENWYDPEIYEETHQIFPVNEGSLEVWWNHTSYGVQWPSKCVRYSCPYPPSTPSIVMASGLGTEDLDQAEYPEPMVYTQNMPVDQGKYLPGFNPNEEHSLLIGSAVYALRDDLNHESEPTKETSRLFVLVKYKNPAPAYSWDQWAYKVWNVVAEDATYKFLYDGKVGTKILPPMPLSILEMSPYNYQQPDPSGKTNRVFKDRKNEIWARAAGDTDENLDGVPDEARIAMRFYYTSQPNFYFPDDFAGGAIPTVGSWMPWHRKDNGDFKQSFLLPDETGGPTNPPFLVSYDLYWPDLHPTMPDNVYTLNVADSLVIAKNNLPNVKDPCSVDIIYMQNQDEDGYSSPVLIYNSTRSMSVSLEDAFPIEEDLDRFTQKMLIQPILGSRDWGLKGLPPTLAKRFTYLPDKKILLFKGVYLEPGEPFNGQVYSFPSLWPNVVSSREAQTLKNLCDDWNCETNEKTGFAGLIEKLQKLGQLNRDGLPQTGMPESTSGYPLGADSFHEEELDGESALNGATVIISGKITTLKLDTNGNPIHGTGVAGVNITFSGLVDFATTDAHGNYEMTVPYYYTGTARPRLADWVFIPVKRDYTELVTDSTDQDYIAMPFDDFLPDEDTRTLTSAQAKKDYLGYVVLAEANAPDPPCPSATGVNVHVFKVECPISNNRILPLYPSCAFDEKLTIRYNQDFAGNPDIYEYQWVYWTGQPGKVAPDGPPYNGSDEDLTDPQWLSISATVFPPHPDFEGPSNKGAHYGGVEFTIQGATPFTLTDNWFSCRYRRIRFDVNGDPCDDCVECEDCPCDPVLWSEWADPQLAEGWISRVLRGINPYDQRFRELGDPANPISLHTSQLIQAGSRWEGAVPLSCDTADNFGLIEIYETVFERAKKLSIDAGMVNEDINAVLLKVSSKLADLYMLLGNEAYADAQDPTISFAIDPTHPNYGSYLLMTSSLHPFMDQTLNLIQEELALLRGRNDSMYPGVTYAPFYNRMIWNFTGDLGAIAYKLNYGIDDTFGNQDGFIDVGDAMIMYPQAHGDAWGHYMSAMRYYYNLLKHPLYKWIPRTEVTLVAGNPVEVNYFDERKFTRAAAAKARTGKEIVNMTYRNWFVTYPDDQWQGYRDTELDKNGGKRAWGVADWASRTGQGAYLDWVTGNAILPYDDPTTEPTIRTIDRKEIRDLYEIYSAFSQIQAEMDKADKGLNPLGLTRNTIPFDIDPNLVDNNQTHFEQVYDRAVAALNNAKKVFEFANDAKQQLDRQYNTQAEYEKNSLQRENDFQNRMIEVFGYPYADDIGPGGTYPKNYNGPDVYHYDYIDNSCLRDVIAAWGGNVSVDSYTVDINFTDELFNFEATANVSFSDDIQNKIKTHSKIVTYNISTQGLGFVKPKHWTGRRKAPGLIQNARSEYFQTVGRFLIANSQFDAMLGTIEDKVELIEARFDISRSQIQCKQGIAVAAASLDGVIKGLRIGQKIAASSKKKIEMATEAGSEYCPKVNGIDNDMTSGIRGTLKLTTVLTLAGVDALEKGIFAAEQGANFAKDQMKVGHDIRLFAENAEFALRQELFSLADMVGNIQAKEYELYVLMEKINQAAGSYYAAVAKGERVLQSFIRFRKETAAVVAEKRYRDMAFRIFRNDALQKYRAQYDLAQRYAYLTAQAYDYETNLLEGDPRKPGLAFMNEIVKCRTLGNISSGGDPLTGTGFGDAGIADVLARMRLNWDLVLKGQLGFNNPQTETNWFSLRSENYRVLPSDGISPDYEADATQIWRGVMEQAWMDNILDHPTFERYCRPFWPRMPEEPGFVFNFRTDINFGNNFFTRDLVGNDSSYDSSNFATKIRSVGVWFENYDNISAGLSNTPRIYLIPAGVDIMRSPSGEGSEIREFRILEQALPVPFPLSGGELDDTDWIPINDSLLGEYGEILQHSSFRAYSCDIGEILNPGNMSTNSRLIGRSVWNNDWYLIIPCGTLHTDRLEARLRFIYGSVLPQYSPGDPDLPEGSVVVEYINDEGEIIREVRDGQAVMDVKLFFQTYAYSGN